MRVPKSELSRRNELMKGAESWANLMVAALVDTEPVTLVVVGSPTAEQH